MFLLTVVDSIGNGTLCPTGFFQCGSGECLHKYRVCDVIRHCPDRSDEINCTSGMDISKFFLGNYTEEFSSSCRNLFKNKVLITYLHKILL